uniref:Squalene synthase n=1 Tax=Triticum aestivum TaxID=4565 RepID=A0A3B6MK08_WHEAT|nr:squalene synthase 1 isoform X2 [Aegilops tauschii subsp. strangulata]
MGVLSRPEEVPALVRLKLAAGRIRREIPPQEHWAFAYDMLQRVSRSFALVIQQLGPDLRNAVCVFYLVLRALDTVEDDTAIPNEVKLPILRDFYRHIYNPDWLFSCGANDYRVLMDYFRQVSTAFLELGEGLYMHSRYVFSPTPWHQGGRVCREQQYMVVGFHFLPPRCFRSVIQGL